MTCEECRDTGYVVKQYSDGSRELEMCLCSVEPSATEWLLKYGIKKE